MKKRVWHAMIFLIVALSISGCGVKDKPLPMSPESLQKFTEELQKATKSFAPTPAQDIDEETINLYKMVIEKKMGYSFDKTFRATLLFYPGAVRQITGIGDYVVKDPKRALDKGYISQRTFDIVEILIKAPPFAGRAKEAEEFIGFVAECQSKNNDICTSKDLMNVLLAHNILPAPPSNGIEYIDVDFRLDNKYDVSNMGMYGWLTKPNGEKLNTNGLFSRPDYSFIVNKKEVALSKRLTEMIAEEKLALSQ